MTSHDFHSTETMDELCAARAPFVHAFNVLWRRERLYG
jgi:hypothetical protein